MKITMKKGAEIPPEGIIKIKKILDVIQKRRFLNPSKQTFEFELGGFGIELKNENDYLELVDTLEGLQKNAGIKYTINKFYEPDRFGRRFPITLYDSFKCRIKINDEKKFKNSCKELEQQIEEISGERKPFPEIYYNENSGIGYIDGRRFKFKDDQPEYKIFPELYRKINKKMLRRRVLELMGLVESENLSELYDSKGNKLINKQSATYKINELAKKIREITGLNTDQLVNNNGNLTLVGKKLKTPPNLP